MKKTILVALLSLSFAISAFAQTEETAKSQEPKKAKGFYLGTGVVLPAIPIKAKIDATASTDDFDFGFDNTAIRAEGVGINLDAMYILNNNLALSGRLSFGKPYTQIINLSSFFEFSLGFGKALVNTPSSLFVLGANFLGDFNFFSIGDEEWEIKCTASTFYVGLDSLYSQQIKEKIELYVGANLLVGFGGNIKFKLDDFSDEIKLSSGLVTFIPRFGAIFRF